VHIAKRHPHRASEAQRQLFELRAVVACRLGCGDQRHEQRQRWQPWNDELRLPRPRHRGRDRFQMRGLEVESEAAVAGPVFMAAFEARAFVAEKHGAWGEYGCTLRRSVLERALRYRSDARSMVLLCERPVARAGVACHVADAPTRTRCQNA
jgi:hypothetical protein